MGQKITIAIGVIALIFAGVQAWDILDKRHAVSSAMVVVTFIISVIAVAYSSYRSIQAARRSEGAIATSRTDYEFRAKQLERQHAEALVSLRTKHAETLSTADDRALHNLMANPPWDRLMEAARKAGIVDDTECKNKQRQYLEVMDELKALRMSESDAVTQRDDIKRKFEQLKAQTLEHSPCLLLKSFSDGAKQRIVIINDRPVTAVNIELGQIVSVESNGATFHHEVLLMPHISMVTGNNREECDLIVNSGKSKAIQHLRDMFVFGEGVSVNKFTVLYKDAAGMGFSREFKLVGEVGGTISWRPGPIKLRGSVNANAQST